jgi:cytidine deaminase
MFYDPKKKRIVDFGSSRPCGKNYHKSSIHAEQNALNFCLSNDKNNRFHIYISRYNRYGFLKQTHCCRSCTQLLTKYKYHKKVFTFDDQQNIIPAIVDNPQISLAYKIKHNL